jgi:epoxyqueuosine reductase
LHDDPSPLVRGHAAWALGEIGGVKESLMEASETEKNPWCLQEIQLALAGGATNATLG